MSACPSTWWELDVVAAKLGYHRREELLRVIRRLIGGGIIGPDEFSAERRKNNPGRGRPTDLVFLAPSAVVAVSAHARTPEAARFRREALARLAEPQAPALPAPRADDTPEQLAELRARLDLLESRVSAGEQERAEIRRALVAPAVQLALFREGEAARPQKATNASTRAGALIAVFERLLQGAEVDGLLAREVVEYARAGIPEAIEILKLTGVTGASNGIARELGKALAKVAGVDVGGKVLTRALAHDNVQRWFVESEAEQ